jgi:hypothetical protein
MRALRSVANADDETFANEDRGFAIADLAVREMGWARHHEQLVATDVPKIEPRTAQTALALER